MDRVLQHPANAGVIRSLCGVETAPFVQDSSEVSRVQVEAGVHSRVVQRLWEYLGHGLTPESRKLVGGIPMLVDIRSGRVLAAAMGTNYYLRIPVELIAEAASAGCDGRRVWSDGTVADLAELFGPGWVFGAWAKQEQEWSRQAAAADLQFETIDHSHAPPPDGA